MAGDDFYDIANQTDEELTALIRQELDEQPDLDPAGLDIRVTDGRVTLAGRVGTEAELQTIEHVLTDVLGIAAVENELVVYDLARAQQPDAADTANAEVYAGPRGQRGGANRTEDTAAHLLEDTGADQFGTNDMGEAIERGYSYNPPTTPTPEGHRTREDH